MATSRSLAPSNAHDLAFIRTVLKLHGVLGAPSELQLDAATRTLAQYRSQFRSAPARDIAVDSWLKNRLPEQSAIERAFLFVRYNSVVKTTDAQRKAFYAWLCAKSAH